MWLNWLLIAWSSHRKNMSSVEKIVIFTYLVSLDAEFLWESHIENPQKSTLGKNNYMQISSRNSWIL